MKAIVHRVLATIQCLFFCYLSAFSIRILTHDRIPRLLLMLGILFVSIMSLTFWMWMLLGTVNNAKPRRPMVVLAGAITSMIIAPLHVLINSLYARNVRIYEVSSSASAIAWLLLALVPFMLCVVVISVCISVLTMVRRARY